MKVRTSRKDPLFHCLSWSESTTGGPTIRNISAGLVGSRYKGGNSLAE
jgi:hypothetical protein